MDSILVQTVPPLTQDDARSLITRVKQHRPVAASEGPHWSHWTISNKYYSAQVQFVLDNGGSTDDADAVIVLVERTVKPKEDIDAALRALSEMERDIALLVTLPPSTAVGEGGGEDEWEDLALEHGFEWVDVDSSESQSSENDDGVGRIVGALHAHVWPSMVPAPNPKGKKQAGTPSNGTLGEEASAYNEFDEESLGVPPLPAPRPFVPTPMTFPSTFLPSIPRASAQPASSHDDNSLTSRAIDNSSLADFDDDFAPFVSSDTASSSDFPPISPSTPSPPTSLYRHPAFSFPDGHIPSPSHRTTEPTDENDNEDESEESDGLEAIFDRLRVYKHEAENINDMQKRRDFAERAVRGLLGTDLDEL